MNIKDLLESLGLSLTESGNHYRCAPIYRNSNNHTSLLIDRQTGRFWDFGTSEGGTLNQLVKLIKNISIDEADKLVKESDVKLVIEKPAQKIKMRKTFADDYCSFTEDYSYWNERGISTKTLKEFGGGLCKEGKLEGRYVFPIYDSRKKIVGFAGRSVTGKHQAKWKLLGNKSDWNFPLYINSKILLESDKIILVESIGCVLSLWECGIKNSICLFGTNLSNSIISTLIKLNPKQIIIALNADGDINEFAGENGAEKCKQKLCKHFDSEQVIIKLAPAKDFNEALMQDKQLILRWNEEN